MTDMANRSAALWALIPVTLILLSCSNGNAPQPGTPAFYWAAARDTYAAGDYQKTVEHLGNILVGQNEYVARAQPWMLVLTSGMAQGYMDLAESFDAGAHANRAQTTNFRRQVNTYRGAANTLALQFADNFSKFQSKEEFVTLAFAYPTGSPTEVVLLNKVAGGAWLPEAEIETAQKRAIEHAMLLATCRAAGAKNDPAKAQDLLKAGEAKVPRAAFVQAMADALFAESQLYAHNKLDQPDKMKIFCSRAQDALKMAPASKESQDLDKKIQAALKKVKA
jgi:predicted pyridoxine 5'-phosphate oxidase superfamily flavin-nucleotide-binding protein